MPRDMVGYGEKGRNITWPNKAKIAISFVVNYEEGAELSPLYGDSQSESYGGEFPTLPKPFGRRNMSIESMFEYGSRAGVWRLIRLFDKNEIPLTFFVAGAALDKNEDFCQYLRKSKHEVAGHGWRWIDYSQVDKKTEKRDIAKCIEAISVHTGQHPVGWYTGRRSEHTREILRELGCFIYSSDSYADDLPYYENESLIIPYSLVTNDFRYTISPGFNTANDFYQQLKNTFDYLYQEENSGMMNIGLHGRISGHPGRCIALSQFLDYIKNKSGVWFARREDIANHWLNNY
ncbi:MAG: polysaccharide deacetylase family protein [Legionellaceae bacterium]|nr:polysaccharide deacetylase family protein [Legionellaceae bacterium]